MATSFILSTPTPKLLPFTASTSAASASSPCSEDSNSSYEDGPAENGRKDKFPQVEQRMYVINRNGTGEASYLLLTEDASAILSYRVHTEKWKPIEGVLHFSVVVIGPWIYVIGGFDKSLASCLKRVIRYDPREGQWVQCKDMIQARSRFGACVVDGKIWVCGGERSDGKVTASCEMYDPEENEWTKCGVLLAPRASPACVGYGSDLLCAGGYYKGSTQNNLWLYEDHRWQELDEHYPHSLPYGMDKCAVAADGNTFYFIGGVTTLKQHEKDSSKKAKNNGTGPAISNSNGAIHNSSNSSVNSSLSSTANKNDSNHHNGNKAKSKNAKGLQQQRPRFETERRVFSFTTSIQAGEKTQTSAQLDLISPWNFKLPSLIHARHSAGAVVIGTKIHVVGGTCVETGQSVKMSEHYDLMTGQWEEDFTLRRCDVSNVSCIVVAVPKLPFKDRKSVYRLRWVMW